MKISFIVSFDIFKIFDFLLVDININIKVKIFFKDYYYFIFRCIVIVYFLLFRFASEVI